MKVNPRTTIFSFFLIENTLNQLTATAVPV